MLQNQEFSSDAKYSALNHIITNFFKDVTDRSTAELDAICEEVLASGKASFIYKGKIWHASYMEVDPFVRKEPLPEKYHARMDIYIRTKESTDFNRVRIHGLVSRALNICKAVEDVFLILPAELRKHLPDNFREFRPKSVRKISDARLARFNAENEEGFTALKQQMLHNMLVNQKE